MPNGFYRLRIGHVPKKWGEEEIFDLSASVRYSPDIPAIQIHNPDFLAPQEGNFAPEPRSPGGDCTHQGENEAAQKKNLKSLFPNRDCSEKTRNLNKNKVDPDFFDQPNIRANKPDINSEFLYLRTIDLKKIRDFDYHSFIQKRKLLFFGTVSNTCLPIHKTKFSAPRAAISEQVNRQQLGKRGRK